MSTHWLIGWIGEVFEPKTGKYMSHELLHFEVVAEVGSQGGCWDDGMRALSESGGHPSSNPIMSGIA